MDHKNTTEAPRDILSWALCFEVGLGLLALGLGRLLDVWPVQQLHWPISKNDLLVGLFSALPPLVIMLGLRQVPWSPMNALRDLVDRQVMPMFEHLSWFNLALISVAAGWGEELLFRGFLQTSLDPWLTPWGAIAIASLLFGLVHFISLTYFALAAGISFYLGFLFWHFESLWVPIIAHTVYDFLMLMMLRRSKKTGSSNENL